MKKLKLILHYRKKWGISWKDAYTAADFEIFCQKLDLLD